MTEIACELDSPLLPTARHYLRWRSPPSNPCSLLGSRLCRRSWTASTSSTIATNLAIALGVGVSLYQNARHLGTLKRRASAPPLPPTTPSRGYVVLPLCVVLAAVDVVAAVVATEGICKCGIRRPTGHVCSAAGRAGLRHQQGRRRRPWRRQEQFRRRPRRPQWRTSRWLQERQRPRRRVLTVPECTAERLLSSTFLTAIGQAQRR